MLTQRRMMLMRVGYPKEHSNTGLTSQYIRRPTATVAVFLSAGQSFPSQVRRRQHGTGGIWPGREVCRAGGVETRGASTVERLPPPVAFRLKVPSFVRRIQVKCRSCRVSVCAGYSSSRSSRVRLGGTSSHNS